MKRRKQRSDAEPRESAARGRAILDSALDAIVTIDERGAILEFNLAAEKTFGRSRSEVLGKQMAELLIPPSLREAHYQGLQRLSATGEERILGKRLELTALRADGSEFPVELAISKVESSGRTFFTGYLRDISEQRNLELLLRQAQKMQAVGQLAGGVAHDLNNLLGLIQLTTDRIRTNGVSGEQLDTVTQAVERGSALTRQLLAFAKSQPLEPRPLALNDTVTQLAELAQPLFGDRITLSLALDATTGTVLADHAQLERVLLNLLVNARDAIPEEGEITIETGNRELDESYAPYEPNLKAGSYVMLAVTDTGTGMDDATRARIFEPFFSTKGEHGTGLGLATAYGIIQQAGGFIRVYTKPGYGTSIQIYLPRDPRAEPPATTAATGDQRVLVIEDDAAIGVVTIRILANAGYDAQLASNLEQALAAASPDRPALDAVVCDLRVGAASGPEIVAKLRQQQPELPIVYMSGYARGGISADGYAPSLDDRTDFIAKPFTAALLLERLRHLIAPRS
ncbi:MAG: two-component system, cell cycle sensor histidine kinase and response regulator CckA [Gaiellaceae bacterium]|nr:two-component system, cell cycle sensor histidine kinase and response regulator CckA [Gaiellaceae bacterium]